MYLKAPIKWGGCEPGSCQTAEITDKTLVRSVPGSKEFGIVLIAWSEAKEDKMAVKSKTHSGAKKRLVKLASGKVKRRKAGRRHLLSAHSAKGMRQLTKTGYVHSANMNQTKRLLNF